MPSFRDIKIAMVVDDETAIRGLVKAILSTSGFQVMEARNGKEALGLIQKSDRHVDVVVTDIRMPEIDGVTLAGLVMKSFPNIPVVLMSGYSERGIGSLESPDRRWMFVQKPFLPQTLIGAVHTVLESSHRPM